jgi:hypothetical protein
MLNYLCIFLITDHIESRVFHHFNQVLKSPGENSIRTWKLHTMYQGIGNLGDNFTSRSCIFRGKIGQVGIVSFGNDECVAAS